MSDYGYEVASAFLAACNQALGEQAGNPEGRRRIYETLDHMVASGGIPQKVVDTLKAKHEGGKEWR